MMARSARTADAMAKFFFRSMDRMRSRQAFLPQTPTTDDFAEFENSRQCLLITYKRSGDAVPSPINFGIADGKLYVRSDGNSGKIKRIRHNAQVVLVPCGFRGTPHGKAVGATARILTAAEVAHADAVIAANWSLPMKLFERSLDVGARRFDVPTTYVEFIPNPRR